MLDPREVYDAIQETCVDLGHKATTQEEGIMILSQLLYSARLTAEILCEGDKQAAHEWIQRILQNEHQKGLN